MAFEKNITHSIFGVWIIFKNLRDVKEYSQVDERKKLLFYKL